jgi:pyruvate kinase
MTNRTKIVATIGPASRKREVLAQLIEAGVNVFRLNFSHGTHEEHSATVADIRALSREMERHVAVLQDLCGPKMRLDPFAGDVVECRLDDEFTLVNGVASAAREFSCSYRALPNDLKPTARGASPRGRDCLSKAGRCRRTWERPSCLQMAPSR